MIIRNAKATDAEAIVQLVMDTIKKINACDYSDSQITAWINFQSVERIKKNIGMGHYIVCTDEKGEIFGVGSRVADQIHALYTAPDHVNQGIGSALLSRMEEDAKSEGINALEFLVTITALPFYMNRGYTRIADAFWTLPNGISIDVAKMKKEI